MYEVLTNRSRLSKQIILLCLDITILFIALYGASALRFGPNDPEAFPQNFWLLFVSVFALGICMLLIMGLSRVKLEAFEKRAILRTAMCSVGLVCSCSLISYMLGYGAFKAIPIIYGVIFFACNISTRISGQYFLKYLLKDKSKQKRVLIYGAGKTGIQLASALCLTPEIQPVAFVDDDLSLEGTIISGLPVLAAPEIKKVIRRRKVDRIFLAIPTISHKRKIEILKESEKLGCKVQNLPPLLELINGKDITKSPLTVSCDNLLGREKINLNLPEVDRTYEGKAVMITGAGGSIGSELCRELITCGIRKLILFEHSEFALYSINNELQSSAQKENVELIPVLGTVTDKTRVHAAISINKVQIILHAAAYKHVPLVEVNEVAGLYNNVIGTRIVAEAAHKFCLDRFILISTDKAVRPSNIMGSSKRLAELVVQDFAHRSEKTLFSMVRFGNVVGSSGSVIPLFRDQIAKGGPVTVTHIHVTRYFMTLLEAARLVLLAGSFAKGGDVFVLDMGKPIRIYDLAKSMIEQSGFSVCDEENPAGEIAIKFTGLRPGEKLYEELLIDCDTLSTPHPKILRAKEHSLSEIEVAKAMQDLKVAYAKDDISFARAVVERCVDGYRPERASYKKDKINVLEKA